MSESRIRRRLGSAFSVAFAFFVIFADQIYQRFIELPLLLTWSFVAVAFTFVILLGIAMLRWPSTFQPHLGSMREVAQQIRESVFAFLFVGLSRVFYQLDVLLLSTVPLHWATWVILLLEANLLLSLWSWMNESSSHYWHVRALRFFWNHVR